MPQSDPSRTEEATPKQRDKAREEGNVPRSEEVPKAVGVITALFIIRVLFPYISDKILGIFTYFLDKNLLIELTPENVVALFNFGLRELSFTILPIMLFIFAVILACQRIQVGHLWTLKPMQPQISQFNPINGLMNILSFDSAVSLVRSVLQAAVIAIAPYIVIKSEMHNLLPLFHQSIEGIVIFILEVSFKTFLYALLPMIIISIIDLAYQRWDYEEQLKMTPDEVEDEQKQAEGDPDVKKEQREKMSSTSKQRMMNDVPQADVVVTNPTHIAVALKYDPEKAPAPLVLAKGADYLAEKIREIARENDVPIRQDKPLAQALYKSVEVGEAIPEEMYRAVAAILAELYKYKKQPG